jgi:tetratricopeptide (TPR) repeat protein
LNVSRQREFNYLIPSREIFTEKQEILIFGHPNDPGNGISYTTVSKIKQQLIINRIGLCEAKLGPKSFGAPVIDNRGNLIGINASSDATRASCIFSTTLLNDTNWIDVNVSPTEIKKHPSIKNAFTPEIWQGMFRLQWNEADQAARLFSSAIRKNPNMALLYVLRGQSRYLYHNLPGCTEDFDHYLKLISTGYITLYLQGMHLLAQNKKQEAYQKFQSCLNQKPNFAPALVEKGKIELYQRRNGTEALRNFASAIAADTLFSDGYYERAKLSYQNEITSRTIEHDLNKAIELNPDLPGVYTLRGNLRLRAENYLQALSDYDKAIEKDAKDMHAYFSRGIVNYNIGMKDKACKDWEKAGSLGHFKAVKFMSEYCNSGSRSY